MIRRHSAWFVALFVSLALGLSLVVWQQTTADVLVVSGLAQVNSSLHLDVAVSPPVNQPGTTLQLTALLTNIDSNVHTPEVTFHLPSGMRVDMPFLPAGLTVNLQARTLKWLPIVAANGGTQQLEVQLRVETADILQPNQTLTAVIKLNHASQTINTPLWVGIPPQIQTILAPPQISVGQPFQLRADLNGSGPFTQSWDLGDGRVIKVNDPVVVFPLAGVYEVRLTASNPLSTVQQSRLITVVPHPAAQFTLDDMSPGVGQSISFINQSGGAQPVQYFWEFGDGTTSTEANPSHLYNALGTYQVHLQVSNAYGQSDAYWPVTVGQAPQFDINLPVQVAVGQPLVGMASGDSSVLRFEWHMGDGRYYEGNPINHTYTQSGEYYVTVVAVNDYGGTELTQWVQVDPGLLSVYLPVMMTGEVSQPTAVDDILAGLDLPPVDLAEPFSITPVPLPADSSPAQQLLFYINEVRSQFNLPALSNVGTLNGIAQSHSQDMAAYGFTAHIGSDGSTSEERFLTHRYGGGYAGETTAWGFEQAYEAVEFWVNSPPHRRILLNEAATEVGVGFQQNYSAPNVWYWTAEFGNGFASPSAPILRVQQPAQNTETLLTTPLTFAWNWPYSLENGQKFVLYLYTNQGAFPIATVEQPARGSHYMVEIAPDRLYSGSSRLQLLPGRYEWQIKLEGTGLVAEAEQRTITFLSDPNAPTATAVPSQTNTPLPPTATGVPATATVAWPTETPLPPTPTNAPPLVTVTPTP